MTRSNEASSSKGRRSRLIGAKNGNILLIDVAVEIELRLIGYVSSTKTYCVGRNCPNIANCFVGTIQVGI